ncbi:MAG: DUF4389 domain-containing protein [Candidatus Micrarchaeota archaeon]|nr:DUF4389 domain-containing protein [Candidatus Micrarchaeota archaeon]
MKTVKVEVKSGPRSPRWELLVRIPWAIVSGIVLWGFSIVAGICWILQILSILFTGNRNGVLNGVLRSYVYYTTKMHAYLGLLTDERNPILPED